MDATGPFIFLIQFLEMNDIPSFNFYGLQLVKFLFLEKDNTKKTKIYLIVLLKKSLKLTR